MDRDDSFIGSAGPKGFDRFVGSRRFSPYQVPVPLGDRSRRYGQRLARHTASKAYRKQGTAQQGDCIMWTKPVLVEVAVGLEINCYACADI